jgi:hypothetical protein
MGLGMGHTQRRVTMLDTAAKDRIIAIIEEHVKVPDDMRDHVCETLYKAYVEAREELEGSNPHTSNGKEA